MPTPLTIIATARAKRGLEALMIAEQIKLVEATRQSPGCIRYELHVSNQEPGLVTFVEQWQSEALWQQHLNGKYVEHFRTVAGHCIGEFELHKMHQVA